MRRLGRSGTEVSDIGFGAWAMARNCEDARTPGLRPNTPVLLTLHLSARTVDNHLQRAYAKLGVTDQAEFASALGSNPS